MAKEKNKPVGGDELFGAPRGVPARDKKDEGDGKDRRAAGSPLPDLVEYLPLGGMDAWRVERFGLLAAEFDLKLGDLVQFHDAASAVSRGWLVCRRLFGIKPVLLPMAADPEEYRTMGASELASVMGIAVKDLHSELDMVRAVWQRRGQAPASTKSEEPKVLEEVKAQISDKGELPFTGEAVLERFGFTESIFHWPGRPHAEAVSEMNWFVAKVQDFEKMLIDKVGGPTARQLMLAELTMRRFEVECLKSAPNSTEWKKNQASYEHASDRYNALLKELNEIFPLASIIAQKTVIKTHFAALISGHQEYYSRADTRIFDGMFTLMEIQVELRRTVQVPTPQYRASLVVMVNAARAGLWDPNWKLDFSKAKMKAIDAAWRKTFMEVDDASGGKLVDVTSSDPEKGEFPALERLAGGVQG